MRFFSSMMAVAMGLSVLASGEDQDGFHIDPSLPDGHYSIQLRSDGNHHVRRRDDRESKWKRLHKRQGSGQYTFLVDEETSSVEAVGLDLFAKQRLPLPPSKRFCLHMRDYSTLNYPLIADDYYASKQAFFNYCNVFQYVEGHVSMALNGSVAVYVCQRRVTTLHHNKCSEAEFKEAEAIINQTCGDSAGYIFIPKWNKEYGRMWKGERVCRKWNDLTYNQHKASSFHELEGMGKLTEDPSGDGPETTREKLYNKTVWQPLKKEDMDDDGWREDYRHMYGQYSEGWGRGWPVKPPVSYIDDKTDSLTGISKWKDGAE